MPPRSSLPRADLLFGGATREPELKTVPKPAKAAKMAESLLPQEKKTAPMRSVPAEKGGGSRPRHDEKVTFYCTDSDLTRLEAARLNLRANHGLACDRSRIVRAALAEVLDDLETRGEASALVKRLTTN